MLLALALLLFQAPVPAPPKADPVPPARIEMTTPFPVHLGSVGPREKKEALFGIRSLHDRPFRFRLLDLSPGLNLDEAELLDPIKPGGVRMLHIKVDPSGMLGYVRGAVRLETDDPAQPAYILRCDMTVRPEVAVDANRRSLGDVAPHESPMAVFRFTREGGEPLRLELASAPIPHMDADWVPQGGGTELRLTLRPTRLKPGVLSGLEVVRVTTNASRQPAFTLYVDWRIARPVVPSPSRLVFDQIKTTLLGLELKARDGRPFAILKAEIQGSGFEVLDHPTTQDIRHVIRVRRTGRQGEGKLVLVCSNLEEPLVVPLKFLDPRARPAAPAPVQAPQEEPEAGHRH